LSQTRKAVFSKTASKQPSVDVDYENYQIGDVAKRRRRDVEVNLFKPTA